MPKMIIHRIKREDKPAPPQVDTYEQILTYMIENGLVDLQPRDKRALLRKHAKDKQQPADVLSILDELTPCADGKPGCFARNMMRLEPDYIQRSGDYTKLATAMAGISQGASAITMLEDHASFNCGRTHVLFNANGKDIRVVFTQVNGTVFERVLGAYCAIARERVDDHYFASYIAESKEIILIYANREAILSMNRFNVPREIYFPALEISGTIVSKPGYINPHYEWYRSQLEKLLATNAFPVLPWTANELLDIARTQVMPRPTMTVVLNDLMSSINRSMDRDNKAFLYFEEITLDESRRPHRFLEGLDQFLHGLLSITDIVIPPYKRKSKPDHIVFTSHGEVHRIDFPPDGDWLFSTFLHYIAALLRRLAPDKVLVFLPLIYRDMSNLAFLDQTAATELRKLPLAGVYFDEPAPVRYEIKHQPVKYPREVVKRVETVATALKATGVFDLPGSTATTVLSDLPYENLEDMQFSALDVLVAMAAGHEDKRLKRLSNAYCFDTECIDDSSAYEEQMLGIAAISCGELAISEIRGRIRFGQRLSVITFKWQGKRVTLTFHQEDDWFSPEVADALVALHNSQACSKRYVWINTGGQDCLIVFIEETAIPSLTALGLEAVVMDAKLPLPFCRIEDA